MRERRDLRALDKEEEEDKLFKPQSRRRVYELRAMADTAGPDQGMAACSNHVNCTRYRGYEECCRGYNALINNIFCDQKVVDLDPTDNLNLHDEYFCSFYDNVSELHEKSEFSCWLNHDNCLKNSCNQKGNITNPTNPVVTDFKMHDSPNIAFQNESDNFCDDKLCELLENVKLNSDDFDPSKVTINKINTDVVKALTIELPYKKDRRDENFVKDKGFREEATTSFVMYFSEGDWCRPLEAPPEDEEVGGGGMGMGNLVQQEEEKKHGGGGSKGIKMKSYSSFAHSYGSSESGGCGGGRSSHSSGSSHSSTRHSRSESRIHECSRTMSPSGLSRQLPTISEGRTEGDGDDSKSNTTAKDSIENHPSSSGKVAQGHAAMAVVQGGRDENQNKTSWKSVVQTNLGERIENVSAKEGSGGSKDSQRGGFNMMQVIVFQYLKILIFSRHIQSHISMVHFT